MSYDLIGDIHGQADKLHALLQTLDYRCEAGVYRHPERQAIFVGDFIDRGPRQRETVAIARAMVEAGTARAVMGNHEFNALAWYTPDPESSGDHLRRHTDKNRDQHAAFLAEVEDDPEGHAEIMDWFMALPLYLDLPELRVVHACWQPAILAELQPRLTAGNGLTPELLVAASRSGCREFEAVETLLKGVEVPLPHPHHFYDKDQHQRHHVRIRWWDTEARDFRSAGLVDESIRETLPELPLPPGKAIGYAHHKPVFIGHYWLTGTPAPLTPKVACLDYSAGNGGPLCAYRWRGETELRQEHFLAVG